MTVRIAGSLVSLLFLAPGLAAQTQTLPTLPGPDAAASTDASAESPDEATATRSEPARRPWEYALGAGLGWDSNIDVAIPGGPSSIAVIPRGGLARIISGRRAELRAMGAGRWMGYPHERERDRYYADFALDGAFRPSPRTSWRASGSYALGYTDSSRILWEQGVLLPIVKTRSILGALGVSRKVGRRATLRVDGRFNRTEFEAPGLVNGESARATAGIERQFGERTGAAIEYSVEDVLSDQTGRSYLTHFASLQWTRVLSRRSALLLEGGASYTPDAVRAALERKESFFGGLGFRRQVKDSNVAVFVRREVAPAFGTGTSRLELRAGVSANVPLGRAWELRLLASRVQPDTPRSAAQTYATIDDGMASLGRRLGRRLELSAEARYRRRGPTNVMPMVDAFQGTLFLTLLSPSGAAIVSAAGR
jgi:hypothetical protein